MSKSFNTVVPRAGRSLVIVSVPFARNSRHLLSSRLFRELRERHDVLVVSPFGDNPAFRSEFGGGNVRFFTFDQRLLSDHPASKKVYGLSELLRFAGFYFRVRDRGMQYYWRTFTQLSSVAGEMKAHSRAKRFVFQTLGVAGAPWTWKSLDSLFGRFVYRSREFEELVGRYERAMLVQTASFGEQERFLAFVAGKLGLKRVLLPYTTDQLAINGYLLSSFEKVFSQGPRETRFAKEYQKLAEERIDPLGCVWFRNIDEVRAVLAARRSGSPDPRPKVIMYAGANPRYFPLSSELAAVDALIGELREGRIQDARLVYRPIAEEQEELRKIAERYVDEPLVEVQIPQLSCYGMSEYTRGSVRAELEEYVEQLEDADVFVMSLQTTMALDAYYLGRPVISNFTDPTGTLAARGMFELIEQDIGGVHEAGMPTARELSDLLEHVRRAVSDPSSHAATMRQVVAEWDYGSVDYVERFLSAVDDCLGSASGSPAVLGAPQPA